LGNNLLAYIGCIAGAISIQEYRRGLIESGFGDVEIIDTGSDLNAYSQVENQSGCCSPPEAGQLPLSNQTSGCCSGAIDKASDGCATSVDVASQALHQELTELLRRFDVNDYAASVRVFAIKAT
jgi:hypothetical protein